MAQLASGGVNNAGIFVEDFSLTWLVGGTVPSATGIAMAFHGATANTLRPAAGTIAGTAGAVVGTGNGTVGTITVGSYAVSGAYSVRFTAATAYQLFDPMGNLVAIGATGTVLAPSSHLTFTITVGGTPFVAGDTIAITVVQADEVCGVLSSYEDRETEGVEVGAICHKGCFRFAYTGTAPTVGQSVGGSAATPGSVITLPARPGRPRVVAVDTTKSTVTVLFA